jgi:hypothetical protein
VLQDSPFSSLRTREAGVAIRFAAKPKRDPVKRPRVGANVSPEFASIAEIGNANYSGEKWK